MGLWKSGKDLLHNGTVLGAITGALLVWGDKVYNWIVSVLPASLMNFAGSWSIPIILVAAGALLGYVVDRY